MLLVTAFFNFILSKKTKSSSPKRPQESYGEQGLTTVCVTDSPDDTFSLFHMVSGRRGAQLATRNNSFSPGERGESEQAMLELEHTAKETDKERKRRWKERRPICLRGREEPMEREMEAMEGHCEPEPDTTSDTAPMITD